MAGFSGKSDLKSLPLEQESKREFVFIWVLAGVGESLWEKRDLCTWLLWVWDLCLSLPCVPGATSWEINSQISFALLIALGHVPVPKSTLDEVFLRYQGIDKKLSFLLLLNWDLTELQSQADVSWDFTSILDKSGWTLCAMSLLVLYHQPWLASLESLSSASRWQVTSMGQIIYRNPPKTVPGAAVPLSLCHNRRKHSRVRPRNSKGACT